MISPDTRPRPRRFARVLHGLEEAFLTEGGGLAGAQSREAFRVLELVAEGEVVRAGVDERVVLEELALRGPASPGRR